MTLSTSLETNDTNIPDSTGINNYENKHNYKDYKHKEQLLIEKQKNISKTSFVSNNLPSLAIVKKPNIKEDIVQRWEGVVTAISDTELTVQLTDLTNPNNPREELTLSKEEIDNSDLLLVKIGAMFYWYIGYRSGTTQTKERMSIIRFRRLSTWSQPEINEGIKLGKEYANYFKGN